MNRRTSIFALTWLVLTPLAGAQVTVDVTPVKVETRYFDPKHPPAELPPFKPNQAAVTVSNFDISASSGGAVVEQTGAGAGTRASVRLDKVNVTLGCDVVMWLPRGVTKKITEHEDGHRRITERFYESAGAVAKKLASAWIGRTVVGTDNDPESAARAAVQSAIKQLTAQYMTSVQGESRKVQEAFDRITVHGTNRLSAKQGMEQSFDEYERGKR